MFAHPNHEVAVVVPLVLPLSADGAWWMSAVPFFIDGSNHADGLPLSVSMDRHTLSVISSRKRPATVGCLKIIDVHTARIMLFHQ